MDITINFRTKTIVSANMTKMRVTSGGKGLEVGALTREFPTKRKYASTGRRGNVAGVMNAVICTNDVFQALAIFT